MALALSSNILAVPTIGLSRPAEWLDASGVCWLKTLVEEHVPQAEVWEYVYNEGRQGLHAQRLLAEGTDLLDVLYQHCTRDRKKVPLVFICHGMGAFALKHALCICRAKYFQYRPVIDVVAGAIFLGLPHFSHDRTKARQTLDLLLKCQRRGIGRTLSTENDVQELVDVCQSFERLSFKVPLISAYESEDTPTQSNLFSKLRSKSKNQIIIPRDLSMLRVETEIVIDSKANHFEICNVRPGSELYRAVVKLFESVMKDAPQRIVEANQPYTVPSGLRDDTLRSPSTVGGSRINELPSRTSSLPVSSPQGATGGSTVDSYEIIPAQLALESDLRDPKLPCFSMGVHQNRDIFVGRDEILKTIDKYLLPPLGEHEIAKEEQASSDADNELHSYAICGLGGMGKTHLAVQYAYMRRDIYEAVFWLNADDANILATNFAQIAQRLCLEEDSSDIAASRDVVMGWLARPLRKTNEPETPANFVRWLLIFDNVDDINVLAEFWPKLGRGSVLVTSRDPFAKHNLYMKHGMNLPPLSTAESEKLIQKLTHVKVDSSQKESLSLIAGKLGGLPLAIDLMSGVFRKLRLSYADFLKFANDEGLVRLFDSQTTATGSEQARSLATIWALDRLSHGTRTLLRIICLLDPDGIPEHLVVAKAGLIDLDGYPKTLKEHYSARSELLASSLIDHNKEQGKLSVHRLVQDTTKEMMDSNELTVSYLAALSLILSVWPFQSMKEHHSIARFGNCETLFPSALRLKDGLQQLIANTSSVPLDIGMARLFNDVGWYMFERGLSEELKPFCILALDIGTRLESKLGEKATESIRESHSFLGIALVETNEHRLSMEHKTTWLEMLQLRKSEAGGPVEDYELGYAYNEIGVAYGNANMLDEAVNAFRRSIEIFQSLEDYEETMLGWPEPNLGFIFWMQDRLDDAEKAFVEILDIHAAAYGVDDRKSFKTGKILYGLGCVLESQGRFDESLSFHKRCFQQFKEVLGANHHRVGDICHRMAGHCMRQRLYDEASGYLDSALRIFTSRTYLSNELARTTFRKGQLLKLMSRESEASELLSYAYSIRKRLRPRDTRRVEALTEVDFDELVAFWSR